MKDLFDYIDDKVITKAYTEFTPMPLKRALERIDNLLNSTFPQTSKQTMCICCTVRFERTTNSALCSKCHEYLLKIKKYLTIRVTPKEVIQKKLIEGRTSKTHRKVCVDNQLKAEIEKLIKTTMGWSDAKHKREDLNYFIDNLYFKEPNKIRTWHERLERKLSK